ncbi:ThuA domain-containing protein [Mycolicibacterium sp. P9-22]|uniref:ThuA domain-containing protein n=1 Tax=Mycolicibacterium sp. P9-22 TaxID=2024613 RepID=UPI0011ECEB28|nr:ThuA domain-containing protein [Mycolicibacterium sp. P9-22]KAA0120644.1 ThuA domain-containing protein [Mycolicibacterium sp. P9-22]
MTNVRTPLRVLLITGGHAFDEPAFLEAWGADPTLEVTSVEHPEATDWLTTGKAKAFDAVVFYDMPGVDPKGPKASETPAAVIDAFHSLTRAGTGMVFLHHALASWPTWPGYAEMVGGRYHFRAGTLRGQQWPDSGYRHDVTHEIAVVDPSHPVCEAIPPTFTITDEVYLAPVVEDVVPLLRSGFEFTSDNFWSTRRAREGHKFDRQGWSHPPGFNLVGWARQQDRSRIVYLQPGDGPEAYANPWLRKLWFNAVRWVANSDSAAERNNT